MILTVFGGSGAARDSADYRAAYHLGELCAHAGWTVATGGYIGVMEAVSYGASQAGGHVIGVTCQELDHLRPAGANPWVREERKFTSLRERLGHLIDCCDAAIAMPGGIGTLAEITVYWNGLIIDSLPKKPLIMVGNGWRQVISILFQAQGDYIQGKDRNWVDFAEDETEAFQLVQKKLNSNSVLPG